MDNMCLAMCMPWKCSIIMCPLGGLGEGGRRGGGAEGGAGQRAPGAAHLLLSQLSGPHRGAFPHILQVYDPDIVIMSTSFPTMGVT